MKIINKNYGHVVFAFQLNAKNTMPGTVTSMQSSVTSYKYVRQSHSSRVASTQCYRTADPTAPRAVYHAARQDTKDKRTLGMCSKKNKHT